MEILGFGGGLLSSTAFVITVFVMFLFFCFSSFRKSSKHDLETISHHLLQIVGFMNELNNDTKFVIQHSSTTVKEKCNSTH